MMKRISNRLEDDKGIIWDPKKHHVACLNHVINLAVQDFLKSIKGLNNDGDEMLLDGEDTEDDKEDTFGDDFFSTMTKVRTITKVRPM